MAFLTHLWTPRKSTRLVLMFEGFMDEAIFPASTEVFVGLGFGLRP